MTRTVPILVCVVLLTLVFAGVLGSSLWFTLHKAAVLSVDDISLVLRSNFIRNLCHRLQSVLNTEMLLLLNTWRGLPGVQHSSAEDFHSFAQVVMDDNPNVVALAYGRPNGEAMNATRLAHRRTSSQIATEKTTFRCHNGSQESSNDTAPGDVSLCPWYFAAVEVQGPVFTYSPVAAGTRLPTISLSTAVYDSSQTLAAVLGLTFSFSALSDQLTAAHRELRSSGMVLLMEQGTNDVIASATAHVDNLQKDVAEVHSILQGDLRNGSKTHKFLHTFGDAVVVQALVSPAHGSGVQWRLVVVLPDSDFYSHIWWGNRVAGAAAGSALAALLILWVVLAHVFLVRPLRLLTGQLVHLRDSLAGTSEGSADLLLDQIIVLEPARATAVPEEQFLGCPTSITELHALHRSVAGALSVGAGFSMQCAQEVAQASELRRAHMEMQSTLKAKESFFAMMTHELRTPLTACLGMAQVLRDTALIEPRQQECVEAVLSNGESMLVLINGILDYSKLEAGKLELNLAPFSPRDVIEQAASMLQVKAEERGVPLVVRVHPGVPSVCVGGS
eukprot:RCo010828